MDLIPSVYKDGMLCFSLQETLYDEGGNVDVTILTKAGELIESGSGAIKNLLKLDFCNQNPLQLLTFYSYNPLIKYYLVKSGEKVIVVVKNPIMKIFKELDGVSSLRISDYLSIGKPLIIMELRNGERVFTDFQDTYPLGDGVKKETPISVKDTLPTVYTQIQKLNLSLRKAELMLRDKRNMSTRLFFKLGTYSEIGETIPKEVDNLVYVIGEKIQNEQGFTVWKSHKVKLGKHWHKYINEFLLFGFYITNTHARDIKNIELILETPGGAVCKSKLFVLNGRDKEGVGEFVPAPSNTLPAKSSGVITGWLSDTSFTSPAMKVSGTLVYPVDEDGKDLKQVLLDPVLVKVSDITSGKLLLSETERSEEDLLSLMSVSEEVRLSIQLEASQPDVSDILQTFGFLNHSAGFLVYPASSHRPFRGLLVRLVGSPSLDPSSKTQDIIVYARDSSQLSLFLLSFESLFPGGSRVVGVGGQVGPAVEAVRREVDHLLRQLLPSATPRPPLAASATTPGPPIAHLLGSVSHYERESNASIARLKSAQSSNKAQPTESPLDPSSP